MDINNLMSVYSPLKDVYIDDGNDIYEKFLGITNSTPEINTSLNNSVFNYTIPTSIPKPTDNEIKTYVPSDDDMSPEDILKSEGVHFKVSSSFRPGAKTAKGTPSNHSKKDKEGNPLAYDIVPELGYTFTDLKNEIYNNPRLVNYFKNRGLGILEETSKSVMAKTHATGPHFHIGPDTWAVLMFNKNLKTRLALEGMKFDNLISSYTLDNDNSEDPEDVYLESLKNNTITPKYNSFSDDFNLNKLDTSLDQDIEDLIQYYNALQPQTDTTNTLQSTENLDIYHKFGLTKDKVKEYVDVMKPIYIDILNKNNIKVNNNILSDLLKLTALESDYGLLTRGNGFNLGGIKGSGTKYKDGNSYKNFDSLYDYALYQIKLLNDKYNALQATSTLDFINRLHGQNNSHSYYSLSPQIYKNTFSKMDQIDKYIA